MSQSCVAIEANIPVAGFINTNPDGTEFTVDDVYDYILSLWNAGHGPIRLNFVRQDVERLLDKCKGVCLSPISAGYKIDKSLLDDSMTAEESEFLHGDKELAKSFHLFCTLQVDMRTPDGLLDAMGFRFMYAE